MEKITQTQLEQAQIHAAKEILEAFAIRIGKAAIQIMKREPWQLETEDEFRFANFWEAYCVVAQGGLLPNNRKFDLLELDTYISMAFYKAPEELQNFYFIFNEFNKSDYHKIYYKSKSGDIKIAYDLVREEYFEPIKYYIEKIALYYTNNNLMNYFSK